MNPNAAEFQPPSDNRAWSNPSQSVKIAKLPRKKASFEESYQDSTSAPLQKNFRALSRPINVDCVKESDNSKEEEKSWKIIGKKGKSLEETLEEKDGKDESDSPKVLSEEELELKRKLRRERRQRAKGY